MRVFFFWTFVFCLSALLLKNNEAVKTGEEGEVFGEEVPNEGAPEEVASDTKITDNPGLDKLFQNYIKRNPMKKAFTVTQKETQRYFSTYKRTLKADTFVIESVKKEDTTDMKIAKKTGHVISAVMTVLIQSSKEIDEETPIIIFAFFGAKGSAAIQFAINEKKRNKLRNILVIFPTKIIRTGFLEGYAELEQDIKNCGDLVVISEIEKVDDYIKANPKFLSGLIIEALFGINFNEETGLKSESAESVEKFLQLASQKNNYKVFVIDVPALDNIDAGMPIPPKVVKKDSKDNSNTDSKDNSKTDSKDNSNTSNVWPLHATMTTIGYTEEDLKKVDANEQNNLRKLDEKFKGHTYSGNVYTLYAILIVGFAKPCHILMQDEVTHIYMGGDFYSQEAVKELIESNPFQERFKGVTYKDFSKDELFEVLK